MRKTLFIAGSILLVASSCARIDAPAVESNEVKIPAIGVFEEDTKAYFGEVADGKVPTFWEGSAYANEKLRCTYSFTADSKTEWGLSKNIGSGTPSADGRTISFTWSSGESEAESHVSTDNAPLRFMAFTPSGYTNINGKWTANVDKGGAMFDLPAVQTPSQTSPDKGAIALIGISEELNEVPDEIKFTFKNVFAYLNLRLVAPAGFADGEQFIKIRITATNSSDEPLKLAGAVRCNLSTGNTSGAIDATKYPALYELELNVNGLNPNAANGYGYLCAISPDKSAAGTVKSMTITAISNMGKVYEKTFAPSGLRFIENKVQSITVNMGACVGAPVTYGDTGLAAVCINDLFWAPVNCGYSAENPTGLVYQWGRKDGLVQKQTIASENIIQPAELPTSFTAGVFYKDSNDKGAEGYSKLISTSFKAASWNELSHDGLGSPCPEGWRVPTTAEMNALTAEATTQTDFDEEGGIKGFWLPSSDAANKIFLPSINDYNYKAGAQKDGRWLYYSADSISSSPEKAPRHLFIKGNATYGTGITTGNSTKAWAYAVRCVKDI